MKKTFFQFGIGFIVYFLIHILFIGLAIYLIIYALEITNIVGRIFSIILASGVIVFFLISLISVAYYRIIFLDDKIYVSGELLNRDDRTQFKDSISYSQISNIQIVFASANSNKKNFSGFSRNHFYPRAFFELVLENGYTKWVYITYFSKKQRSKMIEIINEKTGLNLSYDQILKESKGTKKSRDYSRLFCYKNFRLV